MMLLGYAGLLMGLWQTISIEQNGLIKGNRFE